MLLSAPHIPYTDLSIVRMLYSGSKLCATGAIEKHSWPALTLKISNSLCSGLHLLICQICRSQLSANGHCRSPIPFGLRSAAESLNAEDFDFG